MEALGQLLPNLQATCDLLLTAAALNTRRLSHSTPRATRRSPISEAGGANFAEWLLFHSTLSETTKAQEDLWLNILAIRWLYSAALRCFGDQIPYRGYTPLLSPADDYKALSKVRLAHCALDAGYRNWIKQVETYAPGSQLLIVVSDLERIVECDFSRHRCTRAVTPYRLNERQLLTSHWYFPSPYERKQLPTFLESELTQPPVDINAIFHELRDVGDRFEIEFAARTKSWHRHEAGLIALSVQTCRPIASILKWRVYGDNTSQPDGDCIRLTQGTSKGERTFSRFVWAKRHGHTDICAEVELPTYVDKWLKSLHSGWSAPTLEEMLPYAERPWDARAYGILGNKLGRTPQQAELVCRDYIPRLLYQETANAALINFWRSESSNSISRLERLALTHYLQPYGRRTCSSFAAACIDALGSSGFFGKEFVRISGTKSALSTEQVSLIYKALLSRHESSSNPVDKHNSLAFLTLFICALATGHRRSLTPFPFPWDFFPAQGLVFICDKLIVGSEARFVPFAGAPLARLQTYAQHLKRLGSTPNLSNATHGYANALSKFLLAEAAAPRQARLQEFTPSAGVFFLLDSDGSISNSRLSTRALDAQIESLTAISRATKRFRATLAEHLWERGCSGRLIQAFLGHQPELHVHGSASNWSVHDVAAKLKPHIKSFFSRLGLDDQPSPESFPSPFFPPIRVPDGKAQRGNSAGAVGYEARAREKKWAQHRVISTIRQELALDGMEASDENGLDQGYTPADEERIERRIREELSDDPRALKLASSMLRMELAKLGKTGGDLLSTQNASAPGPVEIGFARQLRCAEVLRFVWTQSIGISIGTRDFDATEALAHLTITLVCFDGVLSKSNLQALLEAARDSEFVVHNGRVTLRGRSLTATHDYEYSASLGALSSALVLSMNRREGIEAVLWQDVERSVELILLKLANLGVNERWTTTRLLLVFRPYWLLHLPGAMYSVASGQNKGPAPDRQSDALLHGKSPAKLIVSGKASSPKAIPTVDIQKRLALNKLQSFFSHARGRLEAGDQRKRVQRAKLRTALTEWSGELEEGVAAPLLVDLLVSFVVRLLEEGGQKKNTLAFSTIETYFKSVVEVLINHAWDFDFEGAARKSLFHLASELSKLTSSMHGPRTMHYFAAHAADCLSITYSAPDWNGARRRVRLRASVITLAQINQAISILERRESLCSHHAAVLIAHCAGYGLRRNEALGLSIDRFDQLDHLHLSVKRSLISDLKTRSSKRTIHSVLLGGKVEALIMASQKTASTSIHAPGFIFEYSTQDLYINRAGTVASEAISALRQASGMSSIVLHSLRHSYATLLGLAVFVMEDPQPDLRLLTKELVGRTADKILDKVLPIPEGWPFAVDAIATALGHATVDTFLDTYFHASSLVIGARADSLQPLAITQERLARLLCVERTKVTKLKRKLESANASDFVDTRTLVREFARPFEDGCGEELREDAAEAKTPHVEHWAVIFRALERRLEAGTSLPTAWSFASQYLRYSEDRVQRYASRYEHLVQETGLDDFEPTSSELIDVVASHSRGVLRGRKEREAFVNAVQRWAENDPNHQAHLCALLNIWFARVSSVHPRLVCWTLDELKTVVTCLEQLGVTREQLDVRLHGDGTSPLLFEAIAAFPQAVRARERASRGNPRVKSIEVSLGVKQAQGSAVPDGRDFHRALIGLYVVCTSYSVLM